MQNLKSFYEIIGKYDGFLFDAYGVLVDEAGVLAGAADLLHNLKTNHKPYWIVSNGSSKTVEDSTSRYQAMGLPVTVSQVITSGGLLKKHLPLIAKQERGVAVLGTEGSKQLVEEAGYQALDPLETDNYSSLVVANQSNYPFLETIDAVLSRLIRSLDKNQEMKVVVTNPDLIYPKGKDSYGITAGTVAHILERSLEIRFGEVPEGFFTYLGKPHSPMFEEARARAGVNKKLLMVGDQIFTDIQGGNAAGMDTMLVGSGLTTERMLKSMDAGQPKPDLYLESLERH